jgi:exosortase A-associated hydrolase 2
METPLFFNNNNYRLFGVLHEPDVSASTLHPTPSPLNGLGMVFCHPFAEEKLISHRVTVNLARRFAKEGIRCLRFDEMGHGDSDGNFEDSTVESRLSDIHCAVDYLRKRTGVKKVGLLGVRFGATLAALTCVNVSDIDCLILISPIVDGKSYIEQCLRSNLATQMAIYRKIIKDRDQLVQELMAGGMVNIDGYLLTKALYEQIHEINLLNLSFILPKNVAIIGVSKSKGKVIDEDINRVSIKYREGNKGAEVLMVQEDPIWKDGKVYNPQAKDLQNTIVNWLHKVYS